MASDVLYHNMDAFSKWECGPKLAFCTFLAFSRPSSLLKVTTNSPIMGAVTQVDKVESLAEKDLGGPHHMPCTSPQPTPPDLANNSYGDVGTALASWLCLFTISHHWRIRWTLQKCVWSLDSTVLWYFLSDLSIAKCKITPLATVLHW